MEKLHTIESEMLRRLKTNDRNAFEYIFRKYNGKIYHFAQATLYDKSLAEDITQNVFLAVWEHRKEIVPEKNFQAYLYTIARNLVYRETEKRLLAFRHKEEVNNGYFNEEDFSTEKIIDARSLEEMIFQLVDKLPEARRKIFLLHFTNDLSNKEIATRLSISEENVEMQVRRSLDYLRKQLKKHIAFVALIMGWIGTICILFQ